MEIFQSRLGPSRFPSHTKLNLRWVFVAVIHVGLAVAVTGGFVWFSQTLGVDQKSSVPQELYGSSAEAKMISSQKRAEKMMRAFEAAISGPVATAPSPSPSNSKTVHKSEAPRPSLNSAIVNGDEVQAPAKRAMISAPLPAQEHEASQQSILIEKANSQQRLHQDHQFNVTKVDKVSTHTPNVSKSYPKPGQKCDLSKGRWIPSKRRLYTNKTCPYIQADQNCMKNGHPGVKTMFMRWKPDKCTLPPFDAKLFLKLNKGKVWAYVGDSLARNQMQSLLCILYQVERPKKIYTDKQKINVFWHFPSYNFTLMVIWSPYLVAATEEEYKGLPKGILKLQLDSLNPTWVKFVPKMDFMILSTGHWLLKPAAYFIGNKVIGCHECGVKGVKTRIPLFIAYETVLRTALRTVKTIEGFSGTVFLRTHSIDHFEDGDWDTGGTCNRTVPFDGPVVLNEYKEIVKNDLYKIGVDEFKAATKVKAQNSCEIKLLDVTYMTLLRPDGHPGKYRDKAYRMSLRAGKIVPNDCLHWCLPGPVDAWNEVLFQMIQDS